MTQPPSAAALEALIDEYADAHWGGFMGPLHAREVFAAFAAQAVAAERAKPAASDRETAKALRRELELLGIDMHRNIADSRVPDILAAALAERGERERERAAQICESHLEGTLTDKKGVHYILFPKEGNSKDGCAYAAAIRNQTGAEGGKV